MEQGLTKAIQIVERQRSAGGKLVETLRQGKQFSLMEMRKIRNEELDAVLEALREALEKYKDDEQAIAQMY
jgi:hypothetical protein